MTNFKLLGSILALVMFCGGSAITFTSCSDKDDEPKVEKPINPDDEDDPNDDKNQGDDNQGDDQGEKPGDNDDNQGTTPVPEDAVPDAFAKNYKYGYVSLPEGTPIQVKEYTSFILSYNQDNHTANYVSWELLASETTGSVDRKDYDYWVDKSLEGCLSIDFGYSTYSYERGHMCPAADNHWDQYAMYDCMVIANMIPQYKSLNSGLWGTLENMARNWAKRDKAIWIVAGPIYSDEDTKYVGAAKARAPGNCFKAFLYVEDMDNARAIAFVFRNGQNPGNMEDYAMTIDELEEITGYDFFSALPDDIEEAVESTFDYAAWTK